MGPIASSQHGRVCLARFQNLNYLFKDLESQRREVEEVGGGHFPEAAGDREPGRTWKQKDRAAPCSEQPHRAPSLGTPGVGQGENFFPNYACPMPRETPHQ